MKEKSFNVPGVLAGLILAGGLGLLADVLAALADHALTVPVLIALLVLSAALFTLVIRFQKRTGTVILCCALVLALCAGAMLGIWMKFTRSAVYEDTDTGKSSAFADKTVLLLIPHEDDDICVGGGVIDEFVKYGSEVYVAFTSNGDWGGVEIGTDRLNEALRVMEFYGVPEDHVVFLGYGDLYADGQPHVYNSGDTVVTSHSGCTATYGLETHAAYDNGADYTGTNYCADILSLLEEIQPDIILGCDYDDHGDHMATSLALETALGMILKEQPDYDPLVLKGFSYSTAYYGTNDFYALNMKATVNPGETDRTQQRPDYLWSERVRVPVSAASLSRSILSAGAHTAIKLYISQAAGEQAFGIVNGDKVYWERRTDSLCYEAEATASSGDTEKLTDFKIIDSDDLNTAWATPYDSVWVPTDSEKTVTVTFPEPTDLTEIRLYDNPDPESNILNAVITFDDGSSVETGALDSSGNGTSVYADKQQVTSFTIQLTKTEGESAGLAELEAYNGEPDYDFSYLKLQNADNDFVYDYAMSGTEESFTLYTFGTDILLSECTVSIDNENCSAVLNGETLTVTCPKGQECRVTVTSPDGSLSDTVRFFHAGFVMKAGQTIEKVVHETFFPQIRYCAAYKLLRSLYY